MFEMIPAALQTGDAQMSAFSEFLGTLLGQVMDRNRPSTPTMFHYTNANSACGIIDKGCIHATHVAFMNDANEYQHGFDLLAQVLSEEETELSAAQKRITTLVKQVIKAMRPSDYHPVFIACFSTLADDLSQWRSYGGANAGFGIGFDINHLNDITTQWFTGGAFSGYVAAAIYDEEEKRSIIQAIVNFIIERYPEDEAHCGIDPDEYARCWLKDFASLVWTIPALLKHRAFSAEAEWRLVVTPLKTDQVLFKPKQGLICPYVAVPFIGHKAFGGFDHPLRRVMIGPTRYTELNHRAIWSMLSLRNYPRVDVEDSGIPYRDVS